MESAKDEDKEEEEVKQKNQEEEEEEEEEVAYQGYHDKLEYTSCIVL